MPIKNHLFTRYKIRKFSLSIQTNELPKFQQGEKFGPFDFRFLKILSPFSLETEIFIPNYDGRRMNKILTERKISMSILDKKS